MDEHKKTNRLMAFCSVVYLLSAVVLLLAVCGYCYPAVEQWTQAVIAGAEDSPVKEAFHVLSDGLESGVPWKEAASSSFSVLVDHAG